MALKPSLADRLRAVVSTGAVPRVHPDAGGTPPPAPASPAPSASEDGEGTVGLAGEAAVAAPAAPRVDRRLLRAREAAACLGGVVEQGSDGLCIVVDRHYPADTRHGRARVGDIVDTLRRAQEGLVSLRRAWPAGLSTAEAGALPVDGLTVIDLETTGLAGGAGTQAFLVGCAHLDGDGIRVRQFLSPGFEFERAQLALLTAWLADRTHLLTFNGRTFDLPLLEMRCSFNRVPCPWKGLPHLDALHPARRFWRDRPELTGPDPDEASCSLGVLERHLAGLRRVGDVPGFEIPARFFQFARDGRAEPLEAVLEHNRLDLVSTLLVCARAAELVVHGPSAAVQGHEVLGLGRIYERLDDRAGAEACYQRAAAEALGTANGPLRGEALRRLADVQRRAGRTDAAAASWQALLATRGVPLRLRREAREALAIHQEHRARDFESARALVLESLAEPIEGAARARTTHRLARLERKLGRTPGALITQLDDDL